MHPRLKVGSIVEYISSTKSPCVAKVIRLTDQGFAFRVFKVNGKPWNEEAYCDYTGWEINQFKIRLQVV